MNRDFDQRILARLANVERTREHMHLYQDDARAFVHKNPFSALFIDMGLGKTVISATVLCDLLSQNELADGEKILVVAPKRVACETWPTEFGLWEHTAPFNYTLIHVADKDLRVKSARAKAGFAALAAGSDRSESQKLAQRAETAERERIRAGLARSSTSIHIISRDWIEWLVNFWAYEWPYRCVVIDESSGFKDHGSVRFKSLAKVRNTPGLITRLHELTATPAAETYEHLFAQMYLMDLGDRLGKNVTNYRKRYFVQNRYTFKWDLRPGAEDEILRLISDICLVMKVEDYLDVEKPVIVSRLVPLDHEQRLLYKRMEEDFIVQLPSGVEVEAETAAALSQKLLQMASGVLYETRNEDQGNGDFKKVQHVHQLHDHKIEALQQIVEESLGEPLLIAYHHKSSLDRLTKAFPQAVAMDRDGKCIKTWNARKIPMLLMHPQSGGHGLNLQAGGHNIVFFDLMWSLELYLQFIGRLARQGQKRVVVVQVLIAAGTIDEEVYQAWARKEDGQNRFFLKLKRLIAERKVPL